MLRGGNNMVIIPRQRRLQFNRFLKSVSELSVPELLEVKQLLRGLVLPFLYNFRFGSSLSVHCLIKRELKPFSRVRLYFSCGLKFILNPITSNTLLTFLNTSI